MYMSSSCANGRVNILEPCTQNQFMLYDRIPVKDCTSYQNAMEGNWEKSLLSDLFFCAENIQILQNGIKAGVYHGSKGQYIIGPQDCDALKIIMRSIFIQHSVNLPDNITCQISALNEKVLDYAVPQVLGEAEGYIKYKRDASTLVVPLQAPVALGYKYKTLELPVGL